MHRSAVLRTGVAAASLAALTATILVASPAQAAVMCDGRRATIIGTAGNDVIHGTKHADVIAALGGSDRVDGRGGNDTICGGEGVDHLVGGPGNDRLFGGLDHVADPEHKRGDTLEGGPGNDYLDPGFDTRPPQTIGVPDTVSWRHSKHGVALNMARGTASGEGHDRIVGTHYIALLSNHDDRVVGTSGDDQIETFAGSDQVWGYAGNDRIFLDDPNRANPAHGPSSDVGFGGAGRDWIIAREGTDRLYGGPGDDILEDRGTTGDTLVGGPGADSLSDTVVGGPQEHLSGDFNDSLEVTNFTSRHAPGVIDLGQDTTHVNGIPGQGYIHGFAQIAFQILFGQHNKTFTLRPWTVYGTDRDESVSTMGSYPVRFVGRGGDDEFLDGQGNDTFSGGPGTDTMEDNSGGTDTCLSVEAGASNCEVIQ